MKTRNSDRPLMPSHLEDERLIAYLDGECEPDSAVDIQEHLESCWDCRSRLSSVERSIESFLDLRQRELLPRELPPSGPALDLFRARLASHRNLTPSLSFLHSSLLDLRTISRKIVAVVNFADYPLKSQVLIARSAALLVIVSIVAAFILFSGRLNKVSAAELLRRSIEGYETRLGSTDQPVVRQVLEIRRRTPNGESSLSLESWSDITNSRVKHSSTASDVADLRTILRQNGLNEFDPLSPYAFRAWSNALRSKSEEVLSYEVGTMTIRTTIANATAGHAVLAELLLRSDDYHAIGLRIEVNTASDSEAFEITEREFTLLSLKDIDPTIFGDLSDAVLTKSEPAKGKTEPSASPEPSSSEIAVATEQSPTNTAAAATAETEVEVLSLLNSIGADVSEQLTVTRTANGLLNVEGIVETDKRKQEINAVLAPVASNPSVRINIKTIEEAVRALAKQKQSQSVTVESVEVVKGPLAADGELREYFSKQGGDANEQIRRYASRVIRRSQSALFQASALHRLAERFTADQIAKLDSVSRAKLMKIVAGHAGAVRRESASLRQELQPVFGDSFDGDADAISSDAELARAIRRLYELASANDRAVRSAFTLNSGANAAAVKSAQFRRNLGTVERLAAAISGYRSR